MTAKEKFKQFLSDNSACCLWSLTHGRFIIEGYLINGRVLIFQDYGENGFDVYVNDSCIHGKNDVDETIKSVSELYL